jgi:hypothetical protein
MPPRSLLPFAFMLACKPAAPIAAAPAPEPASPPPAVQEPAPEPATSPDPAPAPASEPAPPPSDPPPPAPARKRDAHVRFVLEPLVAPRSPTLRIDVHNRGDEPLEIVELEGACFAWHWLSLRVVDPRGRELTPLPCKVKDFPGSAQPIAPDAWHRTTVKLDEVFGELRRGVYGIEVDWDPTRLREALGPDAGFHASSSSLNLTEFAIAPVRKVARIKRGSTTTMPDGAKLTFTGNSHKNVAAGDGPGPLGVSGVFTPPRGKPAPFDQWVHVEESGFFTVGDGYMLELIAHTYDATITVRYFGRVGL